MHKNGEKTECRKNQNGGVLHKNAYFYLYSFKYSFLQKPKKKQKSRPTPINRGRAVPLYRLASKACQRTFSVFKNGFGRFSFLCTKGKMPLCTDYKGDPYFVLREFS